MGYGRRSVLLAATGLVAGCAPNPTDPQSTVVSEPTPTRAGTEPQPTVAPVSTPPTASVSPPQQVPSTASPAVPGRDEIVAEFSGMTPIQWGLEVDGVVRRTTSEHICLTFDACGGSSGSGIDEDLLSALVESSTPATLFLNSRWMEANPQFTRDLMSNDLFEVANHGTRHVPLSVTGREAYGINGTASVGEVYDEIAENQALMTSLSGVPPKFFRSGTAHFDEVAAQIVRRLGVIPVNFNINADAGATFSASQVRTSASAAGPGSISIGHFNRPGSGTAAGIRQAIDDLRGKGATFAKLGDVAL